MILGRQVALGSDSETRLFSWVSLKAPTKGAIRSSFSVEVETEKRDVSGSQYD